MSADVLHELAAGLLAHLVTEMTAAGVEPPERRFVSHGPPSQDFGDGSGCDEHLVVYWTAVAGSQAPLGPAGIGTPESNPEPGTTLVSLVAEVTRCAPTLDDQGRAPTPAAMTEAALASSRDAWALWSITRRSTKRAPTMFGDLTGGCEVRRAGGVLPFGPLGGVQGVSVEMMTQVDLNLWSAP